MYNKNQVKSKEDFQKELNGRFPENQVEILDYTKASGPIIYKCLQCGKIYKKSRANHLYENKTLCSKCYSGKTSELRIAFLERIKQDGFELLDNPNKPISQKFHIRCLKCGREFDYKIQKSVLDYLDCRYCGNNGYPVDGIEFQTRMDAVTKEFKIINYKNYIHSVTLQHNCGYIFSKLPNNFLRYPTCPKCNPKRSRGEQIIYDFLTEKSILFEEQKKFPNLGKLSYDFWLPKSQTLIEYQGAQHYEPINCFGGEEKYKIQIEHDRLKREYALKNNYTLIEISYKDFKNIRDILESSTTIRKEQA